MSDRRAGTIKTRTVADVTFRCSNRVYWHLRWTIWVLALRFPKARLVILQPCYQPGYEKSAGTHDFDAVFDVWIYGLDPWRAQRFLRRRGWAAWFRHTGSWAARSAWHFHMISIPPGLRANPSVAAILEAFRDLGIKVGEYVPGQIYDYFRHAFGLKGQHDSGDDDSWFPENINKTVFRRRWWFQRNR